MRDTSPGDVEHAFQVRAVELVPVFVCDGGSGEGSGVMPAQLKTWFSLPNSRIMMATNSLQAKLEPISKFNIR